VPGRTSKGVSEPRQAAALLANHTRTHAHRHRRRARHAERHIATRGAQHLGGRAHGVRGCVQWRVQGDKGGAHESRESRRAPALTAQRCDTHLDAAGERCGNSGCDGAKRAAGKKGGEGDCFADVAHRRAAFALDQSNLRSFHTVCDGFSHFGLAFTALLSVALT